MATTARRSCTWDPKAWGTGKELNTRKSYKSACRFSSNFSMTQGLPQTKDGPKHILRVTIRSQPKKVQKSCGPFTCGQKLVRHSERSSLRWQSDPSLSTDRWQPGQVHTAHPFTVGGQTRGNPVKPFQVPGFLSPIEHPKSREAVTEAAAAMVGEAGPRQFIRARVTTGRPCPVQV
ncbi:hypothetical protein GWK47_009117 [Chionoecetes opilio]|uniref:Uncharacterized protein n=1 Tax=Chionoecetes opilio TaxID=41210 RepID=A0A8J4Y894_CHIOP|nr:hypothetical protein GWK47_009117 [Chionoecetes opilio]